MAESAPMGLAGGRRSSACLVPGPGVIVTSANRWAIPNVTWVTPVVSPR
jgi:hypothetical protein